MGEVGNGDGNRYSLDEDGKEDWEWLDDRSTITVPTDLTVTDSSAAYSLETFERTLEPDSHSKSQYTTNELDHSEISSHSNGSTKHDRRNIANDGYRSSSIPTTVITNNKGYTSSSIRTAAFTNNDDRYTSSSIPTAAFTNNEGYTSSSARTAPFTNNDDRYTSSSIRTGAFTNNDDRYTSSSIPTATFTNNEGYTSSSIRTAPFTNNDDRYTSSSIRSAAFINNDDGDEYTSSSIRTAALTNNTSSSARTAAFTNNEKYTPSSIRSASFTNNYDGERYTSSSIPTAAFTSNTSSSARTAAFTNNENYTPSSIRSAAFTNNYDGYTSSSIPTAAFTNNMSSSIPTAAFTNYDGSNQATACTNNEDYMSSSIPTSAYISTDEYMSSSIPNPALEEKYSVLQSEFNALKLQHVSQMSKVKSDLKIRDFELKRTSQLLQKTETELKLITADKKESDGKIKDLTERLESEKRYSQDQICKLTMELHEKSMKQSLQLSRRIIELEHRTIEYKKELFSARDQNLILKQEINAAKSAIDSAGRPTTELLNIIQKREMVISQLKARITELELTIQKITKSNFQLQANLIAVKSQKHATFTGEILCDDTEINNFISPSATKSSCLNTKLNSTTEFSNRSKCASQQRFEKNHSESSKNFIHIRKPLTFSKLSNN